MSDFHLSSMIICSVSSFILLGYLNQILTIGHPRQTHHKMHGALHPPLYLSLQRNSPYIPPHVRTLSLLPCHSQNYSSHQHDRRRTLRPSRMRCEQKTRRYRQGIWDSTKLTFYVSRKIKDSFAQKTILAISA